MGTWGTLQFSSLVGIFEIFHDETFKRVKPKLGGGGERKKKRRKTNSKERKGTDLPKARQPGSGGAGVQTFRLTPKQRRVTPVLAEENQTFTAGCGLPPTLGPPLTSPSVSSSPPFLTSPRVCARPRGSVRVPAGLCALPPTHGPCPVPGPWLVQAPPGSVPGLPAFPAPKAD